MPKIVISRAVSVGPNHWRCTTPGGNLAYIAYDGRTVVIEENDGPRIKQPLSSVVAPRSGVLTWGSVWALFNGRADVSLPDAEG